MVCGQNICYHVAAIPDSFKFDMQHDHVLKKMNFDLLTPSPGSEGGGGRVMQEKYFDLLTQPQVQGGMGWVGVWGQNICFHAAAFHDSL